jgi:hypothetical protein
MDQPNNYIPPPPLNDEVAVAEWKTKFYAQTVQELQTEEHFVNFFKNYSSFSVKVFIEHYAFEKVLWHLHGINAIDRKNKVSNEWLNGAMDCLDLVRQKKLFDLQCLWRANKIKLKGVDITAQFSYFINDSYNFPHLSPLNEKDLESLRYYLNERPLHLSYNSKSEFQDYEKIKQDFAKPEAEPDNCYHHSWYDYHNRFTGNMSLLLLPDERGEKEKFYIRLARQEERAAPAQILAEPQKLPALNPDDMKLIEYIVKNFDTKESYKKFKVLQDFHKPFMRKKNLIIEEDLRLLHRVKGKLHIEADDDWRAAVKRAAEFYRRKRVAETLPEAVEELKDLEQHSRETVIDHDKFLFITNCKQKILRGRELNGEPRDLNF